ncbi:MULTISPECIES: hypothetical protein [Bacillus]|uniref:Uncharacterized protein n=1 Tax=Bacillus capparidis TaxID=1840411 RepID=A0ABS4CXS6_9BACI|nr:MULTISPECIES: hypothetical protein [Bacillus]MBP1082166.1 hypothetical protein [Bacillus capparidis]MED1096780.1 hypothetical protein [Bacillus capparidis]
MDDFQEIQGNYQEEFIEYLKGEFYCLYEYLSNGESIDNCTLSNTQTMVILENERELKIIKKRSCDIEFVDEEKIQDLITPRIGLRHEHDIQLHYCLKSIQKAI